MKGEPMVESWMLTEDRLKYIEEMKEKIKRHQTPNMLIEQEIRIKFDNYYNKYRNKVWRLNRCIKLNRLFKNKSPVEELQRIQKNFENYKIKVQSQLEEIEHNFIEPEYVIK